jgi:hypothetical protein
MKLSEKHGFFTIVTGLLGGMALIYSAASGD